MRKMWIMIPLMISCMMLSAYDNRNTDKKGNGGTEEIAFSLDEEESIRNSNLARFGYLTATDDGRIYNTQLDKNAIYVAFFINFRYTLIYEHVISTWIKHRKRKENL